MAADRVTPSRRTIQVNVYLACDLWRELKAAAGVLGLTQAQIVTRALRLYFGGQSAATQRAIQESMTLRQKRSP